MAFNITPSAALSDIETGINLLAGLGTNIDVVGIYQDNTQVFQQGRPLKAFMRETSRIMDHPVETGVTISDHHIINPTEIEMPLFVSADFYVSIYQQIKNAFISATKLKIKTRVNVYPNMVIVDMPHEEDPDLFDAIVINLRMRQILYIVPGQTSAADAAANFRPVAPLSANTVQSGIQSALALGKKALTTAASALSYATFLKRF